MDNLEEHRKLRRAKIIVEDLTEVLRLFTSIKKQLDMLSKYVPVKDVYRCIMENEATVNLHLKKFKSVLDKKESNASELEKSKE